MTIKTYTLKLKGTKGNNTPDITVILKCNNKSQAFNFAYDFFEKGETNIVYGTIKKGLSTIHRWMPDAENLKKYAGKYKVYKTSIICKN
ncbi:MAG: hypothetical protein WC451_05600 [Patescibacteria group bacterium]|jgi:hypothetical protein